MISTLSQNAETLTTYRPLGISSNSVVLEPYHSEFAAEICSWVSTGELPSICSDLVTCVTPRLLDSWLQSALGGFVLRLRDIPMAFATISCLEWDLPQGFCEICHLVVAPEYRRRYHGSFFVNWLTRIILSSNYKRVIGRVVPQNTAALALMAYLRWNELTGAETWANGDYRWFSGSP